MSQLTVSRRDNLTVYRADILDVCRRDNLTVYAAGTGSGITPQQTVWTLADSATVWTLTDDATVWVVA